MKTITAIALVFFVGLSLSAPGYANINILSCKELPDTDFHTYNETLVSGYGRFYNCSQYHRMVFHIVLVNESRHPISFKGAKLYAVQEGGGTYELDFLEYYNSGLPNLTVNPGDIVDFSYLNPKGETGYLGIGKIEEFYLSLAKLGNVYLVKPAKVEARLSSGERLKRGFRNLRRNVETIFKGR